MLEVPPFLGALRETYLPKFSEGLTGPTNLGPVFGLNGSLRCDSELARASYHDD